MTRLDWQLLSVVSALVSVAAVLIAAGTWAASAQ
jgi:hypothetical protein